MSYKFLTFNFNIFNNQNIRGSVRSHKWKSVRSNHLKKYPSCAACGRSSKLEVHHIEPVHLKPEKELDDSNLITLCENPCHFVFGHFMDWRSWNKEVVKDTIVYYTKYKNKPFKHKEILL